MTRSKESNPDQSHDQKTPLVPQFIEEKSCVPAPAAKVIYSFYIMEYPKKEGPEPRFSPGCFQQLGTDLSFLLLAFLLALQPLYKLLVFPGAYL